MVGNRDHRRKEAVVRKDKARAKETAPPPRGEWRELLLVFAVALLLRLIGLPWGLPSPTHYYSYHPDEVHVLLPVLGMLGGEWNPHFFNYGTFYLYLVGFASKLFALVGLSPAKSADLALLYLVGRGMTALLGAASVALVYLIARQLGSRRLALIAAILLTIAPLHLVNSHFATVDVPGTFFILLGAYGALRILQGGKPGWYLLAGAAMGLAAATKYNFASGIILVAVAHLLRGPLTRRQHLWLIPAFIALPLFFLVGCPYALSWQGGPHFRAEFLDGFFFEAFHMRQIRTVAFVNYGSGWSYHALRGLPAALGIPLYLLAGAGIISFIATYRRQSSLVKAALLLFLVWVAVYFAMIGFATERFVRYLMPIIPFLCLFAAWLIEQLFTLTSRFRKAALAGAFVLVGLTALYSFAQLALFLLPDPRDTSLAFLQQLRPHKIGLIETPWFRTPPVSPYNAGAFSEKSFARWQQTAPYQVVVTGWDKKVLEREKPEAFTVSLEQYIYRLHLNQPEVEEFLVALSDSYEERRVYQNPTSLDWLGGGFFRFPPDWYYLKPAIVVNSGWKKD